MQQISFGFHKTSLTKIVSIIALTMAVLAILLGNANSSGLSCPEGELCSCVQGTCIDRCYKCVEKRDGVCVGEIETCCKYETACKCVPGASNKYGFEKYEFFDGNDRFSESDILNNPQDFWIIESPNPVMTPLPNRLKWMMQSQGSLMEYMFNSESKLLFSGEDGIANQLSIIEKK